MQFFTWLESTGLARTVGESLMVTAWLSAVHVIGYTLVMSSGLVWNLRAAGAFLKAQPLPSIARPAVRILIAGLAISVPTGLLLFAPRASYTAPSGIFQLKMVLLLVAASTQLTLSSVVLGERDVSPALVRAGGVIGLLLWLSLAVAACWFILFE
jgi:hypothetical protein